MTRYRKWSLHVLWNPRAWVYSLKNKGPLLKNFLKSKMESTMKLSNFKFNEDKNLVPEKFKEYCIIFYLFQTLKMS